MTSMQQIEALTIEARAHGMTYGQYIQKFNPQMPKPEPTKYKEFEYYEGAVRKKYTMRKTHTLKCEECGAEFIGKRKDARFCGECQRERARRRVVEAKRRGSAREKVQEQKSNP